MSLVRINRNPDRRTLAVFACAWLAVAGLAGLRAYRHGHGALADALWGLAAALPLTGAVSPRPLRWAFVGLSTLTYPIGIVVSKVVLAVAYFLVFTPVALALRIAGRDPMQRGKDPGASTYWVTREKTRTPESYFNQL